MKSFLTFLHEEEERERSAQHYQKELNRLIDLGKGEGHPEFDELQARARKQHQESNPDAKARRKRNQEVGSIFRVTPSTTPSTSKPVYGRKQTPQ